LFGGIGIGVDGVRLNFEGVLGLAFLTRDDRPGLRELVAAHDFVFDEIHHVANVLDGVVVFYQSEPIRRLS
jgi:hypothetical protein